MPPIDLNVPFHEKDDARHLGARWDSVRKTWFLSDDADIAPFTKWLPQQPDINFRASSYFIAQSTRMCWHCNRSTQVFGFLLPRGHEERAASDESVHWERQTSEAIIYYVTYIPLNVQVQMHSITNHYRNDFSKTTQSFYWMNHCEHCRMKQGDFELFEEFDTPFCPVDVWNASRILLRPVYEKFSATATSMAYELGYFESMRISSSPNRVLR